MEWEDLINAIRNDEPYNEVDRGVRASMVTSMGRFAAHTGKKVQWDDYKDNNFFMSPNADKLTPDGPSPLQLDPDGRYPKLMSNLLEGRIPRQDRAQEEGLNQSSRIVKRPDLRPAFFFFDPHTPYPVWTSCNSVPTGSRGHIFVKASESAIKNW